MKNNLKAAFLFSGQLRGFPFCVSAFNKYLFSVFETYDTFFYLPEADGKKLFDCWTPTAVTFERDQTHPEIVGFENNICRSDQRSVANNYTAKAHMQHYFLQWYGVKRVYNLLEEYSVINNKYYDVVFRVRPDILFYEEFNYVPFNGITVPNFSGSGGLYDRFAVGQQQYIKTYCKLYDDIMSGKHNKMMYTGNSESKLLQHLQFYNIPIGITNISFYHSINSDGSYDKTGTQ